MDERYVSVINRNVPFAIRGEFNPLSIGRIRIWPPVVLAPMAGVTSPPFRVLCSRFGNGLFVGEMVSARALFEGNRKTFLLASFDPSESVRSLQLFGSDPRYIGEAIRILVNEIRVDHIDLNFGCPAPKIMRRGCGAAVPVNSVLLRKIVRSSISSAGSVPVTIKLRIGIDDNHETFLETGLIAQDEGCAAIGLHARTATQYYSGDARWSAIARLKNHVRSIPVLGNGDVFEALDALRMMRQTGCDGVVVGRGALGRPWLFRDIAYVFDGRDPIDPPPLGGVVDVMLEHARLLCSYLGEEAGVRLFRKHAAWYTKAFPDSAALRHSLMRINNLPELESSLSGVDRACPYPYEAMRLRRAKSGSAHFNVDNS